MIPIILIILSILSAWAYRLGGRAKDGTWQDYLTHSKTRDIGCSLLTLLALIAVRPDMVTGWVWVAHIVCIGLSWAALSTYHDWCGYDNHYLHGLGIGLSFLPYLFYISWYLILIRAIIVCVFMGWWSAYHDHDLTEEYGRGAIMPITMFVFMR